MQEFNNFTIPLLPFYLVALLIVWSLLKKEKFFKSALLALSFSCGALIFLLVRQQSVNYGNFDIGYSVGMYGSAFLTIPLAIFGWFIGKKLNSRVAIVLSIIGIVGNSFGAFAYQYLIKRNAEIPIVELPFDCSKLPC